MQKSSQLHPQRVPKRLRASRQRGYTLIELSIAMAIIAVVIVGSISGVQRIMENHRVNTFLGFIPTLSSQLTRLTSSSDVFSTPAGAGGLGITTVQAAGLGLFPAELLTTDSTGAVTAINNPFGGNYLVTANAAAVGTARAKSGIFLYITNITSANACSSIVNGAVTADAIYVTSSSGEGSTVPGTAVATMPTPIAGVVRTAIDGRNSVATVTAECAKDKPAVGLFFRVAQ